MEQNKKSTVAKVSRLRLPLRFSWIFRQIVGQKSCLKVLRWSVGIEPTLKSGIILKLVNQFRLNFTEGFEIFLVSVYFDSY